MSVPSVGILGLGFLGNTLMRNLDWGAGSWGASRRPPEDEPLLPCLRWDWGDPETWEALPAHAGALILTVPPVSRSIQTEQERLNTWGAWMRKHRPQHSRLVYVSTTGVYPRKNGSWSEASEFVPDNDSGALRLMTEQQLSSWFALQVVRPGGIYGPGRNLVERLLSGRGIPESNSPTHRIHVHDLAKAVRLLVLNPGIRCLNAVDQEACASWDAAQWLVHHHPQLHPGMLPERQVTQSAMQAPQRRIENALLTQRLALRYPTFREGML